MNKAAQRSITAPDRIGEGKTWVYQRDTMVERGDNSGVHQYGPAEHFTHIISDKPSPKISMLHMLLTFLTMNWQLMYIILT